MLHEWILLLASLAGFGYTGYLDLKTTEFPDWVPYSMIIIGIAVWGALSFIQADFSYVASSLTAGGILLAIGLGMYFARQWGDGDAWLLGALGFMFPQVPAMVAYPSLFPFPFLAFPLNALLNVFIVGFIYMVAYSIALGFMHKKEVGKFLDSSFSRNRVKIWSSIAALAAYGVAAVALGLHSAGPIILLPYFLAFLVAFTYYGKFVEKRLFRKKVSMKELREGDVLVKGRWKGLMEKEVKVLRKKGGHAWIKEGIRFAPVFIITLLVTLLYGSLVFLFI